MITSYRELKEYLHADKVANGYSKKRYPALIGDDIWKFLITLRYCEYFKNVRPFGPIAVVLFFIFKLRNRKYANICNYSIPLNVLGPGIRLAHKGTIVINSHARIGASSTIHVCVNIGAHGEKDAAPVIGKSVYIGPGAKIFGSINIADNVMIGANAVVPKSIDAPNTVWAGIPATLIKTTDRIP